MAGRPEEALPMIEQAMRLPPLSARVLIPLGWTIS